MPRRTALFAALLLGAGIWAGQLQAAEPVPVPVPVPVEAFAKFNKVSNPRLSPDGLHLSVDTDLGDGNHALMIFRIADMEQTALLRFPRYQLPVQVRWVSNERLVIAKGKQSGSREQPSAMGEIIASDFNGENQKYIYGYEQSTRTAGIDRGFGYIEGLPEVPNGHIYMRALSYSSGRSMLYDVDTVKATHRLVADIGQRNLSFALDQNEIARYAMGTDDNNNYLLFQSNGKVDDWSALSLQQTGGKLSPFAFTPDNSKIYAWFSKDGEPVSLVRANPDGSQRETLASDSFASVGDLQWTHTPMQPFAISMGAGVPTLKYLDETSVEALMHQSLRASFPGMQISFVDHTLDGKTSLVYVYSDRDPGVWYLFNRTQGKLSEILVSRDGIDPTRMGERRPFRFTASDGLELAGFMTLPAGVTQPGNLPMVLLPHGGPHAAGDGWSFDTDAQFLASRGYLVLQVNYRGSQGRGYNFEKAGYLNWGTRIQDDLIDGVRWAVDQGYADKERICVYGASFGGYSAMMTAAKAPELFKCAIGFAGVYDLKMMYSKGDIVDTRWGRNYLQRVIGKDDAALQANSPTSLAGRIQAPVLLIHGIQDERAPFAQAKAMRAALEKAGRPPEWMEVPKEGHGFYKDENNIAFYQRLETFLAKNIGTGAPGANATSQAP